MRIIDSLLAEHGLLYAQLDHLEATVPGADLPSLRATAALLAAALRVHAEAEDELLFAAVRDATGGLPGPLSAMHDDHDEIAEALDEVAAADSVERARQLLLWTLRHARDHFAREEHAAFPMAEEALDRVTLERLGAELARRRGLA